MADKKAKRPSFTTPKGTFKYPRLNEPDFGNDKFPKPEGAFKLKLVMPKADAEVLIEKLQPMYDEAMAEAKAKFKELKPETRKKLKEVTENALFTELLDPETEEATGDVEFSFAMTHSGKDKKTDKVWKRYVAIFDAKGLRMKPAPQIWGGTVGKVSFTPSPYFVPGTGAAGLKLNLNAVQVIDLVSNGERSAEGYGFGAEEGYEFEAPAKEETFSDTSDNEATTAEDDGSADF